MGNKLIVPPAKRTIYIDGVSDNGLPSSYHLSFPTLVFTISGSGWKGRKIGMIFDTKVGPDTLVYPVPLPNIFGWSVCVGDDIKSVKLFVHEFWMTRFSIFEGYNRQLLSLMVEDERERTKSIKRCLEEWQKSAKYFKRRAIAACNANFVFSPTRLTYFLEE
jgi:hypothetical protein